jgi:hypothetical protein
MDSSDGCLGGILKFVLLGWLFDFLQDNFGFGKGLSCSGCGCGLILLVIFLALACGVLFNTNWTQLTMLGGLL